MKNEIEELDFSKALPNKFAEREIVIVGDRRTKKSQTNSSSKLFLVTLPSREGIIKIKAQSRKEARREVLRRFNKIRLPRGARIELAV